jgi:hypothetical protein
MVTSLTTFLASTPPKTHCSKCNQVILSGEPDGRHFVDDVEVCSKCSPRNIEELPENLTGKVRVTARLGQDQNKALTCRFCDKPIQQEDLTAETGDAHFTCHDQAFLGRLQENLAKDRQAQEFGEPSSPLLSLSNP